MQKKVMIHIFSSERRQMPERNWVGTLPISKRLLSLQTVSPRILAIAPLEGNCGPGKVRWYSEQPSQQYATLYSEGNRSGEASVLKCEKGVSFSFDLAMTKMIFMQSGRSTPMIQQWFYFHALYCFVMDNNLQIAWFHGFPLLQQE